MSDTLDLHLTDEKRQLYASTRAAAATTLKPIADAGTPGQVNRALVRALGAQGLLERLFPEPESRPGLREELFATQPWSPRKRLRAIDLCLIREALARESTEAETALAVQGLGAYPILQAGPDQLKADWLPRIRTGEAVAAFALTEPDAGSDVGALTLTAKRSPEDDGYHLTGEKLWISNAPDADIYTVFARTEPAPGARGLTAFAVAGDSDGLTGERKHLLAPHAIGSLHFENVYVPDDHRLGAPGDGFKVAMRTLDLFRPSVGACAIGMARTAIDLAVAHATTRTTFGRPLKDNQAVSHRLAEISAEVEAARLLVHRAAAAHDAGLHDPAMAAMAKLLATEAAQEAVDFAVQVHGASGLEQGHPLEHLYREVRPPRIYEGASEIQKEIIARALFRAAPAPGGSAGTGPAVAG
jgi:alkylation response protein AidB-like acyl-CoA dehydrogenase